MSDKEMKDVTDLIEVDILNSSTLPWKLSSVQIEDPEVPAPMQFLADRDLLRTKLLCKAYVPSN